MKSNPTIVMLLVACATFTGCSSTGQKKADASPTTTATATVTAPAPIPAENAVRIPASSRAKLVLNLSGSKICTDSKDWDSFKSEWRAIFQEQAAAAGIPFEWQEGEARAMGQPGTLLSVYVNDYRFIGIGARIFFGIMTGNAYIDAQAKFSDLNGGSPLGEQPYNTSSSAGQGIFGTMTPKQIYAIADDVIGKLKTR